MRATLLLILISCLIGCSAPKNINAKVTKDNNRPNIIIIFADDMGIGDVSGLNPQGKIQTPNLDNMIAKGLHFTDAHTSSSVCTPSRYSLLTGRYNWRSIRKSSVGNGTSAPIIEKNRTTLASLLKKNNYNTAMIGKWHLGWNWVINKGKENYFTKMTENKKNVQFPNIDYTKPISAGPLDNGFDYFFGIAASLDMYPYVYIKQNNVVTQPTTLKAFHRFGPASKDFEAIDVMPTLTQDAVKYINDKTADAKNDKPFFLYFSLTAPHTPILPSKEWQGKSNLKTAYADFTQQVDDSVGQIIKTLIKNGIEDNTLIIFTADNGCSPAADYSKHLAKGHNPSYIYRGHKADLYEGGHRVPFIIQWTKQVQKKGVRNNLIVTTDLLATFADIVGTKLKDNEGEDSLNFNSLLNDSPQNNKRNRAIHHSIRGLFSIRQDDWKLILASGSGGWTPTGKRYRTKKRKKIIRPSTEKLQLYNMKTDVGEYINVAKQHPDIIATLKKQLHQDIKLGRSTKGQPQKNTGKVTAKGLDK